MTVGNIRVSGLVRKYVETAYELELLEMIPLDSSYDIFLDALGRRKASKEVWALELLGLIATSLNRDPLISFSLGATISAVEAARLNPVGRGDVIASAKSAVLRAVDSLGPNHPLPDEYWDLLPTFESVEKALSLDSSTIATLRGRKDELLCVVQDLRDAFPEQMAQIEGAQKEKMAWQVFQQIQPLLDAI